MMTYHVLIRRLLFSIGLFVGVLVVGTFGFWIIGNVFHETGVSEDHPYDFTLLNCFYMSSITVTAVGYGEMVDFRTHLTPTGETIATVFTALFCLSSYLIVVYAGANIVAALVQGAVSKAFQMRRTAKMIERMNEHYIVCGSGTTGKFVVRELDALGESVIAIDTDPQALSVWEPSDKVVGIEGDATNDEVLKRAGLEKAKGVFAVLHDDKDNLFVVLTARQANEHARIVSRATHQTTKDKLRAAGADAIVAPNMIGGLRMASEMVRPNVVSFLDTMLRATDESLRFSEVVVREGDDAEGREIGALHTPDALGINIVAILRKDRTIVYNPRSNEELASGDALIAICSAEQLDELAEYVKGGGERYRA